MTDENELTAKGQLLVEINDPPQAGDDSAVIDPDETATLKPEVIPGSGDITGVAFDNGETTKTVAGEGVWKIELEDGKPVATFTPESGYYGPVTPQEYTVTDENGLTDSGELSVDITDPEADVPPQAGNDSATINPDETATLKPKVTPGTGEITEVAFDNGETTKTVAGEGTWEIKLVDGQPVATFTPEAGYYGPVTPQEYTVTDENELTAKGQLLVEINDPPQAGDDSTTIDPDETATLKPEVVPGSGAITEVAFDNGETTKVVAGEGTWKIELEDGKPVATFTPEAGYYGPVTPQEYTVTDENGLTDSGELSVDITDPPAEPQAGNDSVTINPDETATLKPEVTPGSGAITGVTFDNGETTKVVPGEGTWKIELTEEGEVVATFTPEAGYFGPVTPQKYEVTDENELSAQGLLSVEINDPPQAEDASTTVAQGETATLWPVVTPGDGPIEKATFEDGSNEIVVPGEGTWTIELDETGKVVATFTPEPAFSGVATPQKYVVTDDNGLTATAGLAVTVTANQPGLALEKSAYLNDKNGNDLADAGETIDYSFLLTNTGNTVLTNVRVEDPMLAELGITVTCSPTTLEPGEEVTCEADKAYTVTAKDVKAGTVHNVATGQADTPEGQKPIDPPTDEVDVPTGPVPSPGGGLPVTGGTVSMLGIALVLLIGGGVLVYVRRFRRTDEEEVA